MPFVSYALISDTDSPAALRRLAQYQIAPLLTGIAGIRRVGVLGGQTPEIQVPVTPQRLQAYGLTLADVSKAIAATNSHHRRRTARGQRSALSGDRQQRLHLAAVGARCRRQAPAAAGSCGLPIWPRSISAPCRSGCSVNDNGKPAVTFDVYQQDSADSLSLAKAVDASLAAFMQTQPKSIQLYKWYDQTQLVRSSISAVEEAILIGYFLAALVVFGFLRNWRVALVAMAIVPLSVLITVLLLYLLGMTLQHHDARRHRGRDRPADRRCHRDDRAHRAPRRSTGAEQCAERRAAGGTRVSAAAARIEPRHHHHLCAARRSCRA